MNNNIKTGVGWTILTHNSSPNFKNKEGNKVYLVRCPSCSRENYAMNVAAGVCTWCLFDLNEFVEENPSG